jgi:RHS repeat-associated protein
VPDENPSALGAFEFPLRFPGQYADKETNLHYNYFRDYDSTLGRYLESDPIGLEDGLNPYLYVAADPMTGVDPEGLRRFGGGGAQKGKGSQAKTEPCYLYNIFDCKGRVVYVGRTNDPKVRERHHRSSPQGIIKKYQCPQCKLTFRVVRKFNNYGQCVWTEMFEIFTLSPVFNGTYNPFSDKEGQRAEWREECCKP